MLLSHTGCISGGVLWQVQPYGRTGVMVFFVLLGFVIACIADMRERTVAEYVLVRVARHYSVIVPFGDRAIR